jgi:hypothetical protein
MVGTWIERMSAATRERTYYQDIENVSDISTVKDGEHIMNP